MQTPRVKTTWQIKWEISFQKKEKKQMRKTFTSSRRELKWQITPSILTSLTKKKNYINRTTHTNLFFSFKRPRNNILKRHNLCTRNGKIENTIKGQEIIYSNDTISVKKNGKIENKIVIQNN